MNENKYHFFPSNFVKNIDERVFDAYNVKRLSIFERSRHMNERDAAAAMHRLELLRKIRVHRMMGRLALYPRSPG